LTLGALGGEPLRCQRGRRAQRLKGVALSVVGRNGLCDRVEWPALKLSGLLQAAANEPITAGWLG